MNFKWTDWLEPLPYGTVSCPWWWYFFLVNSGLLSSCSSDLSIPFPPVIDTSFAVELTSESCLCYNYFSFCLTGVCSFLYLSNAGTSPTNGGTTPTNGGTTPTMTPGTPSTTTPGMTPTVFGNGISPSGSGTGFNDGSGCVGFNENRNLLLAVGLTLWLSVLFLWGWWRWRIGWWISMNGWDLATYVGVTFDDWMWKEESRGKPH